MDCLRCTAEYNYNNPPMGTNMAPNLDDVLIHEHTCAFFPYTTSPRVLQEYRELAVQLAEDLAPRRFVFGEDNDPDCQWYDGDSSGDEERKLLIGDPFDYESHTASSTAEYSSDEEKSLVDDYEENTIESHVIDIARSIFVEATDDTELIEIVLETIDRYANHPLIGKLDPDCPLYSRSELAKLDVLTRVYQYRDCILYLLNENAEHAKMWNSKIHELYLNSYKKSTTGCDVCGEEMPCDSCDDMETGSGVYKRHPELINGTKKKKKCSDIRCCEPDIKVCNICDLEYPCKQPCKRYEDRHPEVCGGTRRKKRCSDNRCCTPIKRKRKCKHEYAESDRDFECIKCGHMIDKPCTPDEFTCNNVSFKVVPLCEHGLTVCDPCSEKRR